MYQSSSWGPLPFQLVARVGIEYCCVGSAVEHCCFIRLHTEVEHPFEGHKLGGESPSAGQVLVVYHVELAEPVDFWILVINGVRRAQVKGVLHFIIIEVGAKPGRMLFESLYGVSAFITTMLTGFNNGISHILDRWTDGERVIGGPGAIAGRTSAWKGRRSDVVEQASAARTAGGTVSKLATLSRVPFSVLATVAKFVK